jgi:hypothetical protein
VSTQPARQPGIVWVPGLCHAGCCGRPVGIVVDSLFRKPVTGTGYERYFYRVHQQGEPIMIKTNFSEILDAAGTLPVDAREELIEILQKRTVEERRTEISREIKNARSEHKKGKSKAVSSNELMKELLS